LELSCSSYICLAKKHTKCTAKEMWEGCGGAMETVQEVANFADVDATQLHAGDVADFHGIHVAMYVGDGVWMDSIPERGVGRMTVPVNWADLWYSGRIKVLRWVS
jgi:hypothetical protein